jgi:hypothetical protein
MQQHNIRRTLRPHFFAVAALSSLLGAPRLKAQCASPTAPLATAQIQGETIFKGVLAFGVANRICLGIEIGNSSLLQSPISLDLSDITALAAVRKALDGQPGYSIVGDGLLSVRATAGPATWLDVRIQLFKIPRTDVQTASNALFLSLQQQIRPREGYAGHFRMGDIKDVVGPFDEKDKTVRELLNLIVASSKGALWITTRPHLQASSPPDAFWRILEYSDENLKDRRIVEALEQQIAAAFAR